MNTTHSAVGTSGPAVAFGGCSPTHRSPPGAPPPASEAPALPALDSPPALSAFATGLFDRQALLVIERGGQFQALNAWLRAAVEPNDRSSDRAGFPSGEGGTNTRAGVSTAGDRRILDETRSGTSSRLSTSRPNELSGPLPSRSPHSNIRHSVRRNDFPSVGFALRRDHADPSGFLDGVPSLPPLLLRVNGGRGARAAHTLHAAARSDTRKEVE